MHPRYLNVIVYAMGYDIYMMGRAIFKWEVVASYQKPQISTQHSDASFSGTVCIYIYNLSIDSVHASMGHSDN